MVYCGYRGDCVKEIQLHLEWYNYVNLEGVRVEDMERMFEQVA